MKKKFQFLIMALFFFHLINNAQTIQPKPNKKEIIIGLQTRIIDLLPLEFSLIAHKQKRFSYAIKLGVNYFKKNNFDDVYLYQSGGLGNNTFSHDQRFKALYLKPGITLINRRRNGENFLNLNAVCTYAIENFQLTTEDRIYGKVIKKFSEENFYFGTELEYLRIFNSGFSFGLIYGMKIINPVAFKKVIPNIENASSFSPGMGFGRSIYFNISVGYFIFDP